MRKEKGTRIVLLRLSRRYQTQKTVQFSEYLASAVESAQFFKQVEDGGSTLNDSLNGLKQGD
jgi:hypothetical protein